MLPAHGQCHWAGVLGHVCMICSRSYLGAYANHTRSAYFMCAIRMQYDVIAAGAVMSERLLLVVYIELRQWSWLCVPTLGMWLLMQGRMLLRSDQHPPNL